MLGLLAVILVLAAVFLKPKFLVNVPTTSTEKTIIISPSTQTNKVIVDSESGKPARLLDDVIAGLSPGDTLLFNDGVYQKSTIINITNSGEQGRPITFSVRNKQGATLMFSDVKTLQTSKVLIRASWIIFEKFKVTQKSKAPPLETKSDKVDTRDLFIHVRTSPASWANRSQWISNVIIRDNDAKNASEECYKIDHAKNIEISNNHCEDTLHDGIDMVAVDGGIISNNTVVDVGRVGILAKGGSRNIQIYNNKVSAISRNMENGAGIFLGGVSSFDGVPKDEKYKNEYFEISNSAAWNNVVSTEGNFKIKRGLAFAGAKNSAFFNNIVKGSLIAFHATTGGASDWTSPLPGNNKCQFMNNIVTGATTVKDLPSWVDSQSDYNIFYHTDLTTKGSEEHSLIGDPKLDSTFHLESSSPAIDKGTAVTFGNFAVNKDFDGQTRTTPWDMGLFDEK